MKTLQRDELVVKVAPKAWAEMLLFLSKCGWRPSVATHTFLASGFNVGDEDALSLARAGQVVLEQALKDPLSVYGRIKFDMGKFAEIIDFASGGAFRIHDTPG